MPPEVSPLISRESNPLRPWIRRKLLVCGLQHFLTGVALCALGLGTIAVTSVLVAIVILVLLYVCLIFFSGLGIEAKPSLETSLFAAFSITILLSFWEAWRNPHGLGTLRRPGHLGDRMSGTMRGSSGSTFASVFLGGPRIVLSGINSLLECGQLLRTNVDDAAAILLWMFKRNLKTPAEQLSRAFPFVNLVILIPQLRLLNGFVWLSTGNGICILGSELKTEILTQFQLDPESWSEPEPEPPTEDTPDTPPTEELQWFRVLELDAYASLAEVKKRYRILARQFHPDHHRNGSFEAQQTAEERMKAINEAYKNLCRRFAEA